MTRATLTIAIAFLCSTAVAAPLVTCESPCDCKDSHGKARWAEKTDPALPPRDASAIQTVTPSDIFNWQGPTEPLKASSERIAAEQKWYALTGRVVDTKVKADGDIHIALQDASGDGVGTVSAEIPVGPKWCEIRPTVFGWMTQSFHSRSKPRRRLKFASRMSSLLRAIR